MNQRWSLSNSLARGFRPISYDQFNDITTQFRRAIRDNFGVVCKMEIRLYSAIKLETSIYDPDLFKTLDEANSQVAIAFADGRYTADQLEQVTPELWGQAKYAEVIITAAKNESLLASVTFKGERPRQATFYLQPSNQRVRQKVIGLNLTMRLGDGFQMNCAWRGRMSPQFTLEHH